MKLPFFNKRLSTPEEFWAWFLSPDGQTTVAETASQSQRAQAAISKIGDMLHKVNSDLSWGMVPPSQDNPGRFEVSAGGIRSVIPAVLAVVEAAPQLPNWHVVAFKQPVEDIQLIYAGQEIDSSTVTCQEVGRNGELIDLNVYVPLPVDAPKKLIGEIGFIVLDHTLGEYVVMTKIGALNFDYTINAPPTVMLVKELAAKLSADK